MNAEILHIHLFIISDRRMKDYIQFSCEDQIITHFVEVVQMLSIML